MGWEIVHVPGKLPSSLEESTVDVIASVIEPRLASNLVRQLNQICPLENLKHVKRVRKRTVEGKVELSVILCLSQEHVNHADGIPDSILQFISNHQLIPFNAKVSKSAATSKEEWEEQCKLWPTSYHPPNNNNDGTFGFCEEDSQSILKYIKDAILLAKPKYLGDKVVNAAVIVDPLSKQIIASGIDQTCPRPMVTTERSSKCIPHTEQMVTVASLKSPINGLSNNNEDPLPNFSPEECYRSYTAVSCLYPWTWSEQCLSSQNSLECRSNSSWHPLRHASLAAIENASARDRQLFPDLGTPGGHPSQKEISQQPSNVTPAKRQRTNSSDNEENLVKETCTDGLPSELMRPYLCTGFDIYIVWEPCTMCAMALVHQRIRRIFYAFPNPNAGALGSVYRLHGEKSLNHHYSVFRVMLPEKALQDVEFDCSNDYLIVEKKADDDSKHDDKKKKAKDDDKKEKALWNDRLVEIFVKICVQEVRAGNRPTTHFNKKGWSNLKETFNRVAKKDFEMKQFKNKWDSLKKDWQTWKRLIVIETELGCDANKKTVDASDDWWDRKLKEIPAAAKFRDKGLLFADDMDYIFGDVVATRHDTWAPSSRILLDLGGTIGQGTRHNVIDFERSGDNNDIFRDKEVMNNLHLGGSSGRTPIETSTETQAGEARSKGKTKRKGESTTSSGNWKKQSLAYKVSTQLERLVDAMESHDTHTREREDMYGCKTCINIIYSLPGMEEDNTFFYDCVDLMLKKSNRMMLVSLEKSEVQLRWLKRMVARNAPTNKNSES